MYKYAQFSQNILCGSRVISVVDLVYISLCVDCPVKLSKGTIFSSGSFRQTFWVTDEDSISETVI